MRTNTLRIVSFNIFYALRHKRLGATLTAAYAALNPDVIALQEILIGKKRNFARDLADKLGYHLSFSVRAALGARSIGLAILTKEASAGNATVILPDSSKRRPRILQIADVDINGIRWRIANTHLSVASPRARRSQINAVLATLQLHDQATPTVLAGDFNTKTNKEKESFSAILHDADFHIPENSSYSWKMLGVKRQYDWIATRNCAITRAGTLQHAKGSDHKPVWADIEYLKMDHQSE